MSYHIVFVFIWNVLYLFSYGTINHHTTGTIIIPPEPTGTTGTIMRDSCTIIKLPTLYRVVMDCYFMLSLLLFHDHYGLVVSMVVITIRHLFLFEVMRSKEVRARTWFSANHMIICSHVLLYLFVHT